MKQASSTQLIQISSKCSLNSVWYIVVHNYMHIWISAPNQVLTIHAYTCIYNTHVCNAIPIPPPPPLGH